MEPFAGSAAEPLPGPAVLLVNRRAREGATAFTAARAALSSLRFLEARATEDPAELPGEAARAVAGGARLVIAGGGDGTVRGIAERLAGTGAALAVLPLGTGNDLARSLGIPLDLEEACAALLSGEVRLLDVGRAGGRLFLNAASVGVSTAIARRLSPELKRIAGRLAYPAVAAGEALGYEPFQVLLEVDGVPLELRALEVVIGNGRSHGGGRLIAPEASLTDGLLDLYAIAAPAEPGLRTLGTLARVGARLRTATHVDDPAVEHRRGKRVRLRTVPPKQLDLDGELCGLTPVECWVEPRALRVVVPREQPP